MSESFKFKFEIRILVGACAPYCCALATASFLVVVASSCAAYLYLTDVACNCSSETIVIKEFRRYEAKIVESEKAGSRLLISSLRQDALNI